VSVICYWEVICCVEAAFEELQVHRLIRQATWPDMTVCCEVAVLPITS